MKIISISAKATTGDVRMADAIKMSTWCKEQGLVYGKDYDWTFRTPLQTVDFRFFGEFESFGSLFALTWS